MKTKSKNSPALTIRPDGKKVQMWLQLFLQNDVYSNKEKKISGEKGGFFTLRHILCETQADIGDAQFYENDKLYSSEYFNPSFTNSNKGILKFTRRK